jgi:hypothetical protein
MKVRQVLINDIVEDISIYKDIHKEFINLIREEVDPFYEPDFTFDEFCVKMIENFEGVDEEVDELLESKKYYLPDGKPLTTRLFKAVMQIALDEFKNDEKSYEILVKAIKDNEF